MGESQVKWWFDTLGLSQEVAAISLTSTTTTVNTAPLVPVCTTQSDSARTECNFSYHDVNTIRYLGVEYIYTVS